MEGAGSDVSKAGKEAGNFLRTFGRWIKSQVQRGAEEVVPDYPHQAAEMLSAQSTLQAVVSFAGAVVVIISIKRMNLLRFSHGGLA